MFAEDVKETSEADGTADAREGFVGEMSGEVFVAATATDGADVGVLWEDKLKNSAGVVVETADNFHIGGDLGFETGGFEKIKHLIEFGDTFGVEWISDFEIVEFFDDERTFAMEIYKGENFFDVVGAEAEFFETEFGLLGSDLFAVVDNTIDIGGLVAEA